MQVGSIGCPACQNIANPPEVVVHAGHGSTVSGVSKLNSVSRACCRSNRGTESEDEATCYEVTFFMCCGLNGGADQDDCTTNENADTATPAVSKQSAERKSSNLSQLVYDEDDTGAGSSAGKAKSPLVALHGIDGTHERTVETIERGNQVANAHDHVQLDHSARPQTWLLSLQGSRYVESA